MKHFDNFKMTLFDSTNANFKVAVEAQFSRRNPDMTYRDLVYTTERFSGVLNPNIYLTFAYKGDDINPVYTSYPQLYPIRKAFKKMVDDYETGKVFATGEDGSLFVNNAYSEKVVVSEIGKNNNWLALEFQVIKSGENGVMTFTPGVSIELSTNNGYTSLLSIEELCTVYSILMDLNLSAIQTMMSIAYLTCDPRPTYGTAQPYYQPMPQQQPYNRGYQNYQQPYQQPMQDGPTMIAPQQGYAKPMYNNGTYQPKQYQNSYRAQQTPPPPPATQTAQPAQEMRREPTQTKGTLPPRESNSSIMTLKNVEDTPVSQFDYDDVSALNEIFDNNEENE